LAQGKASCIFAIFSWNGSRRYYLLIIKGNLEARIIVIVIIATFIPAPPLVLYPEFTFKSYSTSKSPIGLKVYVIIITRLPNILVNRLLCT